MVTPKRYAHILKFVNVIFFFFLEKESAKVIK